jgi:hypothetical protein
LPPNAVKLGCGWLEWLWVGIEKKITDQRLPNYQIAGENESFSFAFVSCWFIHARIELLLYRQFLPTLKTWQLLVLR